MAAFKRSVLKDGTVHYVAQVHVPPRLRAPNQGAFKVKTFPRLKDAEAWATAMEGSKDKQLPIGSDRRTLAEFMQWWLGAKAEGRVSGKKKGRMPGPRTLSDYTRTITRWLLKPPPTVPNLGLCRLDRMTHATLDGFYDAMLKVTTARTVRSLHGILRQALEQPTRTGTLARNPAEWASPPPLQTRHGNGEGEDTVVHTMDQAQATAFLKAAREDRLSALWHVLLTGGLRPGEAFGLKWPEVDVEKGEVRVVRNLVRIQGVKGWQLLAPKTKGSKRTVALPPVAMRELKAWKKRQTEERLAAGPEWQDHGFVFTTYVGAPLDGARRSFEHVMAAAGLGTWGPEPERTHHTGPLPARKFTPLFRPYDLRHSCASLLLLAGESLKVVSERLGHASIVMTADVYAHVLPTMQRAAADKLQQMFG